jgi:hypothetical protein
MKLNVFVPTPVTTFRKQTPLAKPLTSQEVAVKVEITCLKAL